ncbi:alpha-glucuronidase family glycosyl hydrolase [Spirochaeta isovalerica]|uniref:Xylan alpha-1,2-glucuronidase n=1 Tax=Spirochaeta isovalerica TaxID=150 RepID=A0A841R7T7_9SPIO|nr:alpha-glucuronidase family glycosyl hydrolase [Spirochaeta isovalerica]MBB6479923.1 alpha-glucuronidase [Spirochaeta isovalerica]
MNSMKNCSGYDLWMAYNRLSGERLAMAEDLCREIHVYGEGPVMANVAAELERGFSGLTGEKVKTVRLINSQRNDSTRSRPSIIAGTKHSLGEMIQGTGPESDGSVNGKPEAFTLIMPGNSESGHGGESDALWVIGEDEPALIYGVFELLRRITTGHLPEPGSTYSGSPAFNWRMLNHWDNFDGTIERGYAGKSLWKWHELPDRVDNRYTDYARACASVGLNGSVLNNVNDAQTVLQSGNLRKVKAIAQVLAGWGIRTFLSVNFASPMIIGGLDTADPLDPEVRQWWMEKCDEIYALIPDFGGFLVKADSEGQPGPFSYNRNHAQGANMLARALAPHGGVLIWRAFVYGHGEADRAKTAYSTFSALDGEFDDNCVIQIKNGAIDFQPREPVHPLFSHLHSTNSFMEFQITQEYLGQGNHIVYLAPMWKEILDFDFASGLSNPESPSSVVSRLTNERNGRITGIAAVSNIGDEETWCGSHFHPLNWYAYGRLAWNPGLSSEAIAEEWAVQTFGSDEKVIDVCMRMLLPSWETCINYMTPLGLHHIMKEGHHYGPDPGFDGGEREDWRSTYYHRADRKGLGFDRSPTGTKATEQYPEPCSSLFGSMDTCPEKYLLWFHHVPWDRKLSSGRTLMDEIEERYKTGVSGVEGMISHWDEVSERIDPQRARAVREKLEIQLADAREWMEVCVPYFRSFK